MNKDILTDNELIGTGTGTGFESGTGYGTGYVSGTGSIMGDGCGDGSGFWNGYEAVTISRYFANLKIEIPYNFPTRVLNYYNETIDNYE